MKELRYFICLFLMIISLSILCSCSVEQGPIGPQGVQGEAGNGISSIKLTNTDGLVDTYTIYFTDGTTTTFTVTNGKEGLQGIQGETGKDGHTPVITIENGYWYIDGVNTLQPAQGIQGETGNGISSIKLTNTEGLVDTYTIYFTDGTTTTFTVTNGKDSNDNNSLYGLNVLCVGDSITVGQGMNQNERWANVLAEKYDWNLTVNAAGGIPMSSYYYTENSLNDISICKKIEI